MVSSISTRTLILGAITLGGLLAWKAYSSQSGSEYPRPAESPSTDVRAESRASDEVQNSYAKNSEAESQPLTARATVSSRPMTTSAAATRQSSDASSVEAFTEPYSDIAIAASEMGTLSGVKVKEGDVVKSGDLSVREDLEIKQLEFRRIEAQLEQRSIRSPISGIVSEVTKDAGEFVSPSDPVVARVVQLDPLLVVFSVPLQHRNAFHQDQTVSLQLGYADMTAQGTVEFVSRTTDTSNSSIRVKVRLPNPNGEYQSGERALLRLDALTAQAIPTSSSDDIASPIADRNHETASRQ